MNKMHNEEMIDRLLEVVQGETKPAIGCTEPVAVALAAATARKYLKEDFKEVNVKVSKNIFKRVSQYQTLMNVESVYQQL